MSCCKLRDTIVKRGVGAMDHLLAATHKHPDCETVRAAFTALMDALDRDTHEQKAKP